MSRTYRMSLLLVFLTGCAGFTRSCDSSVANHFGANWLIVQYAADGHPINCWTVTNTSIANETQSDGIYWEQGGALVHISGWYNRVQVSRFSEDAFANAANLVGVDLARCRNGKYMDVDPVQAANTPTNDMLIPIVVPPAYVNKHESKGEEH